jgi:hypothetical protein
MAYEVFRKVVSMDEYFKSWDSGSYDRLTSELKQRIYDKYVIKAEVFQRDNFKCQNTECKYPESHLTLHHVKFQKNGGKDSGRNCLTLCKTCHQGFHRAKRAIVLADSEHLPPHMRGHTFQLTIDDSIDWKKVKSDMKQLRKNLCTSRIILTDMEIAMLMRFLEIIADYESEDD